MSKTSSMTRKRPEDPHGDGRHGVSKAAEGQSSFLRAETPAFRPVRKRALSLTADIFGDDGQRSATARGDEVGGGPQHPVVVAARHLWTYFAKLAARYALQAVDQLGQRDLRRVAHQEVNVIVLPGALHQLRLK